MDSVNFFTTVSGVFKSAQEAFDQAVKEAQQEKGVDGNTGTVAEKEFFVELEVPKGSDPLAFAKERAGLHGNNFWNYNDGPAACVEIKGTWLIKYQPKKTKYPKGYKMFVFFGSVFSRE